MEKSLTPKQDNKISLTIIQSALKLGFTLILLGYFLVWLPQPVVGLSFIGLEIGEWAKFLPQVRSGELSADRNLFYLPPVTLGFMLAMWTSGWPNRRWQTWATRVMAVLIACLAFPSVEVILSDPSDQWLIRLVMVFVVILATIVGPIFKRLGPSLMNRYTWATILILGLIGAILPTWAYLTIRPAVVDLFRGSVGIGPGLLLNIVGHLLAVVAALIFLMELPRGHKRS